MKNYSLILQIIKNKRPCVFVSPHFDDAVFSAGAMMSYLAGKVPLTLINVFTKAGKSPMTYSAKKFVRQCGYHSVATLFRHRNLEDQSVLDSLSGDVKHINLGFIDALWRKKSASALLQITGKWLPELTAVYPTYRWHVARGKIATDDRDVLREVKCKVEKHVSLYPNSVIFCPLGVGNHVDHLIVKHVCQSLRAKIIFWTDYPYCEKEVFKASDLLKSNKLSKFCFSDNLPKKAALIRGYKTQFEAVFRNSQPVMKPETYYTHFSHL